jgi:lysophospholipase L1-like esterase
MLPNVTMINNSKSGRTIGFDNLGSKELNALTQIDTYLAAAEKQTPSGKYDYIILCLGTNDTKKEFADRQNEVVANFDKLLSRIERHKIARRSKLIFVTPPPMGTRNMEEKYAGGNERLSGLVPQLMTIASRHGFQVIDVYHPLLRVFDAYTPDGVHMVAEGQKIIASKIVDHLPVYPR